MIIDKLQSYYKQNKLTVEQFTSQCIERIAENDVYGKKLNSIAIVDPDCLQKAKEIDEQITTGTSSLLQGVVIAVKDNIDLQGFPTTAGSYALTDNIAKEDATIVKKLKEAGAIVIGKTNLSEFAYWMSRDNMPSGYSSLSGQVIHPYIKGLDPSGSSSGSGVAVAARLIPVSIGSETDGSLCSPATANSIVAIKPTVGLVSRSGILPLSSVQDTAGPMGLSVKDCAIVLQAIAGKDENDSATLNCVVKDYISSCQKDLNGLKIGVYKIKGTELNEKDQIAYERLVSSIKENNGEVVEFVYDDVEVNEFDCLALEFKHDLNEYLSKRDCKCRSLADIIQFNKDHAERCLVHGQDLLLLSESTSGDFNDEEYAKQRREIVEKAHQLIDGLMDQYHLDGLASIYQLSLSPVSGNPCMSIPALSYQKDEEFEPMNYYFMSKAYQEDKMIHIAYAVEQSIGVCNKPSWAKEIVE